METLQFGFLLCKFAFSPKCMKFFNFWSMLLLAPQHKSFFFFQKCPKLKFLVLKKLKIEILGIFHKVKNSIRSQCKGKRWQQQLKQPKQGLKNGDLTVDKEITTSSINGHFPPLCSTLFWVAIHPWNVTLSPFDSMDL